jgi:hypothetical protein
LRPVRFLNQAAQKGQRSLERPVIFNSYLAGVASRSKRRILFAK